MFKIKQYGNKVLHSWHLDEEVKCFFKNLPAKKYFNNSIFCGDSLKVIFFNYKWIVPILKRNRYDWDGLKKINFNYIL